MSCCIAGCSIRDDFNENFISCSTCDNIAHAVCLTVNTRFSDTLTERVDTHWFCPHCNPNIKNFGKCRKQLSLKLSIMKKKLNELVKNFNDCNESLKSFDWLSDQIEGDQEDSIQIVSVSNSSLLSKSSLSLMDSSPRHPSSNSLIGDTLQLPMNPTKASLRSNKLAALPSEASISPNSDNATPQTSQSDGSSSKGKPLVKKAKHTSSANSSPKQSYKDCLMTIPNETEGRISTGSSPSTLVVSNPALAPTDGFTLKVVPKRRSLFISRFTESTSESDILQFLKAKLPSFNASVTVRKFKFKEDRDISSFKIDMPSNLFESASNPEFWPDGVICKEFVIKQKSPPVDLTTGQPKA